MNERHERLNGRSMLAAGLVIAVGALLGVAGFAVDQARATWRPVVTKTASGWRISQPHLGVDQPALAAGRLVWTAGAYTVMADLASGRSKLLGVAGSPHSVFPPRISSRFVVWQDVTGSTSQQSRVFSYDIQVGRRQHWPTGPLDSEPVVCGTSAYWASPATSDTDAVVVCDLETGRRRVLAEVSHFVGWLTADNDFVVWARQPAPQAQFTLTLFELATGTARDLVLPGQSPGSHFGEPVLAGGVLVWLRMPASGSSTIESDDLRTAAATLVATGAGLTAPAFDGATVVWAQQNGTDTVVYGRRPSGDVLTIATVKAPVASVMVSGRTVAWWAGVGADSWVATTELP